MLDSLKNISSEDMETTDKEDIDMFIGRQHQMKYLKEMIFTTNPEKGFSCSLRGPNGIGKTYLKNHILEQFQEELDVTENRNVFVIDVFMHSASYYEFFLSIFKEAAACLSEEVLNNAPVTNRAPMAKLRQYLSIIRSIDEINAQSIARIRELLRNFFSATSALGFYFILIIDEFDNAIELYPRETDNGELFRTLFELSAKVGKFKRLSVMLISRRRAGTIAHHMESGSNFDDAYPADETVLRGFDEREMAEYYQSFSELPCGELSEKIKKEISFYVGGHPGLLMSIRTHIRLYCDQQEEIRIIDIYRKNGSGIRTAFSRMIGLLKSEYTDRANQVPAMSAFKQMFNLVPTYDANLRNQAQLLYDFGFVTDVDPGTVETIEDISPESEKCLDVIREAWYAPLSKQFLIYVKENLPIAEKNETHRLIDATEMKFRDFLQKHLQRIYGDTWQDQIDTTEFSKGDFWENLQKDAQEYGALSRGVEVSVLDVLAFYNLGKIVKRHWERLKPYFPSFRTKNELYDACYTLTKYRNCCMHGTLKILGVEQHNELKKICGLLMADFDRYMDGKVDEESLAEPLQTDTSSIHNGSTEEGQVNGQVAPSAGHVIQSILSPLDFQARSEKYNGTEHDFKCETKKPRGNLIGTLIDINMPASIAPKDASKITDADPIGKVYRVRIEQWDNGPMAQKFNVVPIV